MTALEKITAFVGGYPGADILREFQIDYTDQIFINGGALPPGLVEISRKADLMGRVAVVNQYNFGPLKRPPGTAPRGSQTSGSGFKTSPCRGWPRYSETFPARNKLPRKTACCMTPGMGRGPCMWSSSASSS